jgi:hypothetical protein
VLDFPYAERVGELLLAPPSMAARRSFIRIVSSGRETNQSLPLEDLNVAPVEAGAIEVLVG